MTVKDILNQQVTLLSSVNAPCLQSVPFEFCLIETPIKYKNMVLKLRSINQTDHNQYKKLKCQYVPCFIASGVFNNTCKDTDIKSYSNIIILDIDESDNTHINLESVRSSIFELPYVVSVFKSLGGKGLFVVVSIKDGRLTPQYYEYLSTLFKQKFNINVDKQCKNLARKRFISYDEEYDKWIKPMDTEIIPWSLLPQKKEVEIQSSSLTTFRNTQYKNNNVDLNELHNAIQYLLNDGFNICDINCTERYHVWWHIGCDFSIFEDGERLFIQFSTNSPHDNDTIEDIRKQYKGCKPKSNIQDIATKYFGICKRRYGNNWKQIITISNQSPLNRLL